MTSQFNVGDKVMDRGGFTGRIVKVTFAESPGGVVSHWYDVRLDTGTVVRYDLDTGTVVRYDYDLTLIK